MIMSKIAKKIITATSKTLIAEDGTEKKLVIVLTPKSYKNAYAIHKLIAKDSKDAYTSVETLVNSYASIGAERIIENDSNGFPGIYEAICKLVAEMHSKCMERDEDEKASIALIEE